MIGTRVVSKHRIEAFSDGVYSIAATLLVLDLKLGPLAGDGEAGLTAALLALLPRITVWLLSFWVMATYWLAQQRAFEHVGGIDGRGLRIELTQLALIALLPFTTGLIGEHGELAVAAAIYAANIALLAFFNLLRVTRLRRLAHLQGPKHDPNELGVLGQRAGIVLVFASLATALAFVAPSWNMLAMLPLLVVSLIERVLQRVGSGAAGGRAAKAADRGKASDRD